MNDVLKQLSEQKSLLQKKFYACLDEVKYEGIHTIFAWGVIGQLTKLQRELKDLRKKVQALSVDVSVRKDCLQLLPSLFEMIERIKSLTKKHSDDCYLRSMQKKKKLEEYLELKKKLDKNSELKLLFQLAEKYNYSLTENKVK